MENTLKFFTERFDMYKCVLQKNDEREINRMHNELRFVQEVLRNVSNQDTQQIHHYYPMHLNQEKQSGQLSLLCQGFHASKYMKQVCKWLKHYLKSKFPTIFELQNSCNFSEEFIAIFNKETINRYLRWGFEQYEKDLTKTGLHMQLVQSLTTVISKELFRSPLRFTSEEVKFKNVYKYECFDNMCFNKEIMEKIVGILNEWKTIIGCKKLPITETPKYEMKPPLPVEEHQAHQAPTPSPALPISSPVPDPAPTMPLQKESSSPPTPQQQDTDIKDGFLYHLNNNDFFQVTNNEKDYLCSKELETWLKEHYPEMNMRKLGMYIKKFCPTYHNIKSDAKNIEGKMTRVWHGLKKTQTNLPPSPEALIECKEIAPILMATAFESPPPIMAVVSEEMELKKSKKATIPKPLKQKVWAYWIGIKVGEHKCLCCNLQNIQQGSFACGHIIAESNGGELKVSNLKPICNSCNSSMGTQNMNEFIQRYF